MKNEFRKKYLKLRKNINNKSIKDNIIFNKVINNSKVKECTTILIYVSRYDEVDTISLIKYFLKFKKVAIPKIENNIMNFYYINSIEELKLGAFNILEPISSIKVNNFNNSVSITPGICFDKYGYRIGYGKGYYDKFYEKHNVFKIGLCYKECLIDKIDTDIYDISVDQIITD